MKDDFVTKNAEDVRDRSFNLILNEKYGDQEVEDIVNATIKVQNHYQK